jgi:hypothetical protein
VRDRRAEHAPGPVAEQLVDPAAEQLDVGDQALERGVDEPLHLLGVEVLGERREAHDIGEQHRDDPALLQAPR